jgi:hypothetical protein
MTYEELVRNHSGDMIEKLVTEILSKEAVEIRFEFEDNDQWAVISMHIYEEDKEISLRLHANDRYDLCLGYYDDKDDFFEIIQPLKPEEKAILPKKLHKVMEKVLTGEQGLRIPSSLLSN